MVTLLILAVVLLAIAWLAFTMLPHPLGIIVGVVAVVILLILLIQATVGDGDGDLGTVLVLLN